MVDTRDMVWVHAAMRGEFSRLQANLAMFARADADAWDRYAEHWQLMHDFLIEHHTGEDNLLWPLLRERLPDRLDLIAHMEDEHRVVHQLLGKLDGQISELTQARATASPSDINRCVAECDETFLELIAQTIQHLEDEEQQILPAVPGALTPKEWALLPQEATAILGEEASVKVLGYVLKWMPAADRPTMLATLPPDVVNNWEDSASADFERYDAALDRP